MQEQIAGAWVPKTPKGRQRVLDILVQAEIIWREMGHEALSLHEIARQLKMRLSNVQYYFPTKNALLLAMFSYRFQKQKQEWQRLFQDDVPAEQVLERVVAHELELGVDDSIIRLNWQTFLCATSLANVKDELNQAYRWLMYKYTLLLNQLRTDLNDESLADLSVALFSLLQGAHNMLCIQPEKEEWRARYLRLALQLVRDYGFHSLPTQTLSGQKSA